MPNLTKEERVEQQRVLLDRPAVVHVTTTIVPVKRDPGPRCPVTGSTKIRAVDEIEDLSVLIREGGNRINRWELDTQEAQRFDDLAGRAEHYTHATGPVWHCPIVLYCPVDHVDDLIDDETQVIYWSGGWRSGKSYRGLQWWVRGWVRYGCYGERFWLMGPQHIHAFRLMQKIFFGRKRVPPILPTRNRSPVLALDIPEKVTKRELTFKMIDGSIIELQHAHGEGGHLEGESVRRILFDEAWNTTSSGPYEVALGRVMEDFGQVGISSVPDEDCVWLYESVVAEFDKTKHEPDCQFKVRELSGYDNPWIDPEAIRRREKATPDEVTRDNKIYGKWSRRGLYYYADVWDQSKQTRDEVSHEASAWGLGDDITARVLEYICGIGTPYGGGVDFSRGGEKPQTRLWFKIFGNFGDANAPDWLSWNLVFVDEESTRSDSIEAAAQSRVRNNHAYEGSVVIGDAEGFDRGKDRKKNRNNDARHWKNAGFHMLAPVRHAKPRERATYENPKVGSSRTSVREVMRRHKMWVNAGRCPGLLNAIDKAPNRRKSNNDKNTWIEKKVYGFEDVMRYVVWKIFSRFQEQKQLDEEREIDTLADRLTAA